MGRYCYLQFKRLLRYLPGALCVVLVLLLGLSVALSVLVSNGQNAEENQKVRIAMVGTAEDSILQMGMTALRSFDSTQFSLELVELESEAQARQQLKQGSLAAYILIPEGFMEEAMAGNIMPLKLVSTTGNSGMVTIFKEEVSRVISGVLLDSQKGVYGMQKAMRDNDIGGRGEKMTLLALRYAEYVLARDKVYRVDTLGIGDALSLGEYLACGLSVLLLHLCCLPFAPLMIRRDLSLARMLSARGRSAWLQALCDLGVYLLGLTALTAVTLAVVAGGDAPVLLLQSLPVLVAVGCFSFMLYALSRDLIGGVLLQFFLSVAMCFVSGCLYPVYFFPVAVQRIAEYLPAGLARSQLAGFVTGEGGSGWLLLAYGTVFCLVGIVARVRAVKEAKV